MEEQIKTAPQTDVEVVDIQFRPGQKIYFFDPDGQRFADGDLIIIDTACFTALLYSPFDIFRAEWLIEFVQIHNSPQNGHGPRK